MMGVFHPSEAVNAQKLAEVAKFTPWLVLLGQRGAVGQGQGSEVLAQT